MPQSLEDKKYCKLSEQIVTDQLDAYLESVSQPKFICLKCFRVSHSKQNLCRPKKLKKLLSSKKK